MLQSDPNAEVSASRPYKPVSKITFVLLTLMVLGVIVLRLDWWNWHTAKPLLFGVIPIGLWWQVLVSLAATATMWALVTFAWPAHLEHEAPPKSDDQASS